MCPTYVCFVVYYGHLHVLRCVALAMLSGDMMSCTRFSLYLEHILEVRIPSTY